MNDSRTDAQCADMFTKPFRELPKWQQAIRFIGIGTPGSKLCMPRKPGPWPGIRGKKKEPMQPLASDDAAEH